MRRVPEDPLYNSGVSDRVSIFDLAADEISFADQSMDCCVCFVDMVDSTKITARLLDHQKIRQYYSIFINTMAILARNYDAKIIKNAGDGLIFYFPETSDSRNERAFKNMLECFTIIISAHNIINSKLQSENLPSVSYRISADYGRVEIATSTSSQSEELFGSTMNICAKINSMAEPNGIVIGGDLYEIVKSFSFIDNYHFKELGGYSIGFKHQYPVYRALSKNNTSKKDTNNINQLFSFNQSPKIKGAQIKQQSQLLNEQHHQEEWLQQQKHSANIMIVDDESDTLFTYNRLLSAEGYKVESFTDPQEALRHFVQLPDPSSYYQLVLLDIRMPRLNGLQLFYRIKAISPNIKIMFISALDIAEELTSILPDIKYNDIIKKPVKREYLIRKINSALNITTRRA
jgi:two-component system, OmpR family, response regulator ChvI